MPWGVEPRAIGNTTGCIADSPRVAHQPDARWPPLWTWVVAGNRDTAVRELSSVPPPAGMNLGDAYVCVASFLTEPGWVALMLTHALPQEVVDAVAHAMDVRGQQSWGCPRQLAIERAGEFWHDMHEIGIALIGCSCDECNDIRRAKRRAAKKLAKRKRRRRTREAKAARRKGTKKTRKRRRR